MERLEGWGVTPIRFETGDVLALRAVQEPAPRIEVWHRPPAGGWVVHRSCPPWERTTENLRVSSVRHPAGHVRASWSGGAVARVEVGEAGLRWILRLRGSPLARLANAHPSEVALELHGAPDAAWLRLRVHGGKVDAPTSPWRPGAEGSPRVTVLPRRILVVGSCRAVLDGRDLGTPSYAPLRQLGGLFPWRAPGILVEGEMRVRASAEAATLEAAAGF